MTEKSVGAIWKKTINTNEGKVDIFSIAIGDKNYTAWVNKFKNNPKHPDYKIYPNDYKKTELSGEQQKAQEDNYQPKTVSNEPKQTVNEADDLPF